MKTTSKSGQHPTWESLGMWQPAGQAALEAASGTASPSAYHALLGEWGGDS